MRRRMEAGLRHPQPAQAVAALHDLSTGAFPARTDHETASSFDQDHPSDQASEFPRQPLLGTRTRSATGTDFADRAEASIRCQRTLAAGSEGPGGCRSRVQAYARVRASWIPAVTLIGKTKPSCG